MVRQNNRFSSKRNDAVGLAATFLAMFIFGF